MKSKRVRTNAYTTAIERRIRRFYVILVMLGILAASLYFLITPYLARRSMNVPASVENRTPEEIRQAGEVSEQMLVLSNQVAELQADLKKSREDYELLQGMLADKERAFQELFETYDSEQKQYAEKMESVKQMEQRAGLAEAEQNRIQAELNAANALAASLSEKNTALKQQAASVDQLIRENREMTRLRDEALEQAASLERRLRDEADEAAQQKKALAALNARMEGGETNAVLLESVAMAQWRLLRYDAEWVLRKLASAPTNACEDIIAPCRQRLAESLNGTP